MEHLKEDKLFDWVSNIIDTCTHDFHFDAVDRLIELYFERTKNEENRFELEYRKTRKWNDIHMILK